MLWKELRISLLCPSPFVHHYCGDFADGVTVMLRQEKPGAGFLITF
jgi:hypothetical protein